MVDCTQGMSAPRHRRDIEDIKDDITGGGKLGETCVPENALTGDTCNMIMYCNTDNLLQPQCKLTWWFILIIVVVGVLILGSVLGCILKALGCCCC